MEQNNSKYKSYPRSKNGLQCVGPCYQAGTQIVHPETLEYTTNKNNPFCPVAPWEFTDKDTGKKMILTTDECNRPTENKDLSGKEFEINILTPTIDFNSTQFLKIYYNIYSFEDAISFITDKKYLPLLTRCRIINCALASYGKDLNMIDHRVIDFFIELVNTLWIEELFHRLEKYINIDNGKISFGKNTDNNTNKNNKNIIINFIKSKFVNNDEIMKFLMRYIKYRKDVWDNIESHIDNIKDDFIDYIENKVQITIN